MNPIDKLDADRAWRDQLDYARLDEVDGPEVVAEANHYEAALRDVLRLADRMGIESYPCDSQAVANLIRSCVTSKLAGDRNE